MSDITLTDEQFGAIKAIREWYLSPIDNRTPFVLAGAAGCGKSTAIKFIADELKIKPYQIRYVAYMAKAARVITNKGNPATTIHSLIYEPREYKDENGKIKTKFVRKNSLGDVKLIICDEASTVGKLIQTDLQSYNIPILFIGDHFQLHPIDSSLNNLMLNPSYRLETIMRQSLDNPILFVANQARLGKYIKYGKYGTSVLKTTPEKIGINTMSNANQILCGKNVTRRAINEQMRDHYGFTGIYPNVGEKLICLKNNNQNGLVNGMIGTCTGFSKNTFKLDFTSDEDEVYEDLLIDHNVFRGVVSDKYLKGIEKFDFSTCITVHKAQGSEWDNVIVYEERFGDNDFHNRFLYTAITRAINKLIILS